jgi:DNA-binding NtrC family response regulator
MKPGGSPLDLEPGFQLPAGGVNLEKLQQEIIRQALQRTQGNKTRAAELLSLTRDTLRYRIEKYELEIDD